MSKGIRIVMTGSTGLLGRNLLFEFIKKNIDQLDQLEVLIMGGSKFGKNLKERMNNIVLNDGRDYLSLDDVLLSDLKSWLNSHVYYIESNLCDDRLGISNKQFDVLKNRKIDYFFHIASMTSFQDTAVIRENLHQTNVLGTIKILDLAASLKIEEFIYIGSAYSCGNMSGDILPDYIDVNQKFRNPYEKSKLNAELLVRQFAKETKSRCRFIRPSTICGRLIEPPLGKTNKFDVFYAYSAFYLKMKMRVLRGREGAYKQPVNLDMRLFSNENGGLNIIPVDFAAKVLYEICTQNDPGESYHLTNNEITLNSMFVNTIFDFLNIKGVRFVYEMPDKMNTREALYYKTVGKYLAPYGAADPMIFNTDNLKNILSDANLSFPKINSSKFKILLDYAKKYDFGLNREAE